ncbi:MAG TPA: hypothetical protein VGO55_05410 [Allosphingosinicella sp.]|jgi:hypothetical protein|nr:hypothetical protein [Allosphingosinicella sp.]
MWAALLSIWTAAHGAAPAPVAPVAGQTHGYSCRIESRTARGRISIVWYLDAEGRVTSGTSGGSWVSSWDGEVLIGIQWHGTAPDPLTPATRTGVIPLHFTERNQPRGWYRLEMHVVGAESSPFGMTFASG